MQKKVLYCIIGLLCACSAGKAFRVLRTIKSGELEAKHFKIEIPFKYENGLIILHAKVNDSENDEFILDSGAPAGCITDRILKNTKLNKITDFDATDVNSEKKKASWYIADSIRIEELIFKKIGLASIDFANPAASCLIKSGLIGMNMIDKCIWHIDYPNRKIILTSNLDSITDIKKSIRIPIKRDIAGYIYADFKFNNGKEEKLLFDLGYSDGFISVPKNFFHEEASGKIVTSYGNGTGGAFSISKDTVYTAKVKSISLGEINFPFATITAGKESRFSFGNKLIQYFYVTLNIKDNEMYLSPIPGKEYQFGIQSFGFDFDFTGSTITVGTIFKDGPAERAGLTLGGTILSINDKNVIYKDYCEFFSQRHKLLKEINTASLKIQQNETQRIIVLQKERIL